MSELAWDNAIGKSTGYDYLHEGIDVLAGRAPSLHGALLAAKAAGYSHVNIDGTLIETDRVATPARRPGVDLWWSAKHHNHGGNAQVVTAPDGWPIWTSHVRPGREHDTTAVRTHTEILPALADIPGDLRSLGDLGYEGESGTITIAFEKPKNAVAPYGYTLWKGGVFCAPRRNSNWSKLAVTDYTPVGEVLVETWAAFQATGR